MSPGKWEMGRYLKWLTVQGLDFFALMVKIVLS